MLLQQTDKLHISWHFSEMRNHQKGHVAKMAKK
jgi:hypothetical protein